MCSMHYGSSSDACVPCSVEGGSAGIDINVERLPSCGNWARATWLICTWLDWYYILFSSNQVRACSTTTLMTWKSWCDWSPSWQPTHQVYQVLDEDLGRLGGKWHIVDDMPTGSHIGHVVGQMGSGKTRNNGNGNGHRNGDRNRKTSVCKNVC